MRYIAIAAGIAVAVLLGTTAYFILSGQRGSDQFAQCRESTIAGGSAAIGGPFTLTRGDGQRVTDADVIDGPTLIYFGFTYCPDVCPLDVSRNAAAVDLLEERGILVKPVMISVDPGRDTPEVIGEFASWMHPRMVGLTGSAEELSAAQQAYRVFASRRGEGEDYLYDHSTFSYLMAPGHGLLEFFRRDVEPEELADRIACFTEKL